MSVVALGRPTTSEPADERRHVPATSIPSAFALANGEGRCALLPYVVAGYPDAARAFEVALAVIDAGADLLEIGLPYSDPVADGATLQRASALALAHGASLAGSIAFAAAVHEARPSVPLVVMGYTNQIVGSARPGGADALLRDFADAGVRGLILADLPPEEAQALRRSATEAGVALVHLVTPTTPADRRSRIAAATEGFLYAVALTGVTGARGRLPPRLAPFLVDVRARSPVPVAVGFGIAHAGHVRRLASLADGVVVGSALVDALGPSGHDVASLSRLVGTLSRATKRRAANVGDDPAARD